MALIQFAQAGFQFLQHPQIFIFSEDRFQDLGRAGHIEIALRDAGGNVLRQVMAQKEINLVAIGIGLVLFVQVPEQQPAQTFFIQHDAGLQHFPHVGSINAAIGLVQPQVYSLQRFGRFLGPSLQVAAAKHFQFKLLD